MGVLDKFTFTQESKDEKTGADNGDIEVIDANHADFDRGFVTENNDQLQRRLGNRQIQLLAIGGSIGTALFVSIGSGLAHGGPGSLFIAYSLQCFILGFVNNSIAEMTTAFPVSGGFIRLAGHFVDDAWGFMAGWNFFLYEAILIPFEITALCTVLGFWRDDIPYGAVIAVAIVLYALINVLAVKLYGEAEFWLSGGKVILIFMLFSFTFVTMCGGNPKGDAYGFRYWDNPGAFAEYMSTGDKGRFEGFLAALWSACFTVVGPEYISMVSAEAKRPRIYIKNAFRTVYWRFLIFFGMGSLMVGISIPYNDPKLVAIVDGTGGGGGTATASPYVISMQNLGVTGLPHVVNALLVTSIFSAGNTYTYCATRSLYGLALDGRAPKVLRNCTASGVPIYCFFIVMIFPCLSFLQLGNGSSTVLLWLTSLITAGGVINYIVMQVTYVCFYKACKVQGLDRRTLPYYGRCQPWGAWIALVYECLICLFFGYACFRADPFDVAGFFYYYTLVIVAVLTYTGWKIIKRTPFVKASEVDLVWERPIIDAYEDSFVDKPIGFWQEMIQIVGLGKRTGGNDRRKSSIAA